MTTQDYENLRRIGMTYADESTTYVEAWRWLFTELRLAIPIFEIGKTEWEARVEIPKRLSASGPTSFTKRGKTRDEAIQHAVSRVLDIIIKTWD